VQGALRGRVEIGAIGEEDEQLAGLGVTITDAPQVQGLGLRRARRV